MAPRRAEIRPADAMHHAVTRQASAGGTRTMREVLEERPALDFLEVHSENFFGDGGAALAGAAGAGPLCRSACMAWGLALGLPVGIDAWHLAQLARLVERIDPVRVSDHACFARGLGGGAIHAADLLPIPFNGRRWTCCVPTCSACRTG
jgi:uncharacterized protein (UPF0276 family)